MQSGGTVPVDQLRRGRISFGLMVNGQWSEVARVFGCQLGTHVLLDALHRLGQKLDDCCHPV